jgi:hypothetical protein
MTEGRISEHDSSLGARPPVANAEGRVRLEQLFAGLPRVPGVECSQNCSCSSLEKTEGLPLLKR